MPISGQAYEFDFPVFDTSGKLVPNATFDSVEIAKDGNPLVGAINSPFPVLEGAGTASPGAESGLYTMHLTDAEMTILQRVSGRVVVSTAGAQDVFF